MNGKSIGVFDSGLGGLTVFKEIMKRLPNENLIYFGDTGRVPYGTRSHDTIVKYTRSDIRFLMGFDVKTIVIACGTASSAALPSIRSEFDIPIVGVVEATVSEAARRTKNGKIGIIATPGTIKSGAYERLIKEHDSKLRTFTRACPLFVPLVENGHFDTPVTRLVAEEYLGEIRAAGVDTLILGCTHYPLIKRVIAEYMGDGVELIEPGVEVSKHLGEKFSAGSKDAAPERPRGRGSYSYYVSDSVDSFEELGGIFLGEGINGQVEKIDIEKY